MTDDTFTDPPSAGTTAPLRDTTFARGWNKLGHQIERVAARAEAAPIEDLIREAERLIAELVWRTVGDNVSLVANVLQASRKRVRQSLVRVRRYRRRPRATPPEPSRPTP